MKILNVKKLSLLLIVIISLFGCTEDGEFNEAEETAVAMDLSPTVEVFEEEDVKAMYSDYDENELTYDLVWSDEFDYVGLPDVDKWSFDVGGFGWGNNELQYYTKGENAFVENGVLTITARKEDYKSSKYTSSRMVTKQKGDWLYGKIEVRAKLPKGRGTWPAIWMLPSDWEYGNWPNSGEIDIMEHVGYEMGIVHGTVHTAAYNHMLNTQVGDRIMLADASETFHIYSVQWYPDKIKFLVDENEYYIYEPLNLVDSPSHNEWPFDQSFHLLLNIAIGGNWGGAKGVDDTIFPQKMEVDYVRVYQSLEFKKEQ